MKCKLELEIYYSNGIVWNCIGFDRFINIEYDLKKGKGLIKKYDDMTKKRMLYMNWKKEMEL